MLLHISSGLVILNLIWIPVDTSQNYVITGNSKTLAETDKAVSSVLNNITRVNKVLEDLIENYETLQNLYDTAETFESVSGEHHYKQPTTAGSYPSTFGGHLMFTSAEGNEDHGTEDKSKENFGNNIHLNMNNDDDSDTSQSDLSSSEKYILKTGNNVIYFDGIKNYEAMNKIRKEHAMNNAYEETQNRGIKYMDYDTNNGKMIRFQPVLNAKSYRLEKISNNDLKLSSFRSKTQSEDGEELLQSNQTIINFEQIPSGAEDNEEKNEEAQLRDVITKTNALREAYGNACLKLVVRKCYKACKSTTKEICKKYECRSKLKTRLLPKFREQCVEEFRGNDSKINKPTQEKNIDDKETQAERLMHLTPEQVVKLKSTSDDKMSDFKDITRKGYITGYCLLGAQKESEKTVDLNRVIRNQSQTAMVGENLRDVEVNILRDRYERACAKISSKKCTTACAKAFKEVCKKGDCRKKLRTNTKKYCKRNCGLQYDKDYIKRKEDAKKESSESSEDSSSSIEDL